MIKSKKLKKGQWYIEYDGDKEFSALVLIKEVGKENVKYLEYLTLEDDNPQIDEFDHASLHAYKFLHLPELKNHSKIRKVYPELFI